MDFHAVAQRAAVVHSNVRVQKAACTQRAAVFHHRVRQNAAAFAQHRIFADIHVRADFAAGRHNGGGLNHGGGMHACARRDNRMEQPRHFGEIKIRVVRHNQVAAGEMLRSFGRHDDGRRRALFRFGLVFRIGQEGDFRGGGADGRGDGGDFGVAADEFSAQFFNDLG